MGNSWMKLNKGNKLRFRHNGCRCCSNTAEESYCILCYSDETTLVGYRGTGDDDHFICEVCLKKLNDLMKGKNVF